MVKLDNFRSCTRCVEISAAPIEPHHRRFIGVSPDVLHATQAAALPEAAVWHVLTGPSAGMTVLGTA